MAEPESPKRGLRGGGRVLLYVSLLLNLAVVGLVVGVVAFGGPSPEDRRPPRAAEMGFGPLIMALDEQDRRVLGRRMFRALRERGKSRGEMRVVLDMMATELRAEPFDPAAMEALLTQQFAEVEFRLAMARDIFLMRLSEMSMAERAALADRLDVELARSRQSGPDRNKALR